ncbi:MAG: NUDIX hydrolase [Gammaproteobacteria bacterium]|nr:NUDIX hydrolase [Gammaproteobacteria bacterium]
MSQNKQHIFSGRIIKLEVEQVELPNGTTAELEIVRHPGGAAVVAINDNSQVCLLKQYRYAVDQWVWELPAGKIDNQEPPLETAHRELEEEAGVQATFWHELGAMISSPGVFDELVYLYLAKELKLVEQQPEEHEVFELHWVDFVEALNWSVTGKINDAKTVIALFRASQYLASVEEKNNS